MVTNHIEKAWKAYRKNFWHILCAVLLFFVITTGLALIGLFPLLISFIGTFSLTALQSIISNTALLSSLSFSNLIFALTFFILALIIGMLISASLVKMYAEALKGKTSLSTLFKTIKKKFRTILGANILVGLIMLCIFGLAFVPLPSMSATNAFFILPLFIIGTVIAVLISLLFKFTNQAIVIDNCLAIPAIKKSISVAKANYIQLLALIVIFVAISILVGFIPYINFILNWLLISPIAEISFTALYIAKRKKRK